MTRHRTMDPQLNIHRLERKHTDLAVRVASMDSRLYLSASEQLLLNTLKREKLATKDAITSLRRTH